MPSYRPEIPDITGLSFGQKLKILGRVLQFVGPYRRFLVMLFLLTMVEVVLTMIEPFFAQFIIDDVLLQRDTGLLDMVFGAMIGLFLVRTFYSFIVQYISYFMQSRANFDVRKRFFQHLQSQSIRFYEQNASAEIAHTEGINLPQLQQFMIGSIDELTNQSLHLVVGMALMLLMNWQLAGLTLLFLPLWVIGTLYFTGRLAPIGQAMNDQEVRTKTTFTEMINGIEAVQIFNRQGHERKRYFGQLAQAAAIGTDNMLWSAIFRTTVGSVSVVGTAFVFWFGGHQIIKGEMTIGQLIAFNMLLGGLFGPVSALLGFFQQINTIAVAGLRVFAFWDLKPEISTPENAIALRNIQGYVEFVDVGFGYEDGQEIIHGVSFEALPGQTLAFCGPSGSGKSTIARLLTRFYDPLRGEIFVDGHNLKDLDLHAFRGAVGVVSQRPFMFQDTIANNIRYGKLDASEEEIIRAARTAQADEFISKLPEGYDTVLGVAGSGLSGGQIQRISIARTLLANPRILVLDEATSALDTETEHQIKEALEFLLEGRTTFVIAHRLSTIVRAHRIHFLKGGQIAEQGTHEELLARRGEYFALWQHQLGTA